MDAHRYKNLVAEFDVLLSLAQKISERLIGTPIETREHDYADAAFLKLIAHAISLRKLVPSPDLPDGEFWDLGSASAVSRALIESFDSLAYIGLSEVPKDELTLRILVWELHDQQRRLQMLQKVGSIDPRVREIEEREAQLTQKITAHPCFNQLSGGVQNKLKKRDAPAFLESQQKLNEQNGIDHDYYIAATMFLSQYVHTFPMSLQQLTAFQAGEPDALALMSMPLQYALPFLAKAIDGAERIWPAGAIPKIEQKSALDTWLAIARDGVGRANG